MSNSVLNPIKQTTLKVSVERYKHIRAATEKLAENLSDADATVQSMEDASPAKWHLGHVSWFFETVILKEHLSGYQPFEETFHFLFNSYYETLGERHPRPLRGMLTRPSLDKVLEYRAYIDKHMHELLDENTEHEVLKLVELGLNHEQQHQELLLTDILHLFAQNPVKPCYKEPEPLAYDPSPKLAEGWTEFAGGIMNFGADGVAFSFDCERPKHKALVHPFKLANGPVTNRDWLKFIAQGGYENPLLWLSDGWALCQEEKWQAPLYWQKHDNEWWEMTLRGLQSLDLNAPVCHVSYYEADAYATWAGKRLPYEYELELAAQNKPVDGVFSQSGRYRPAPVLAGTGVEGLFGNVWEWTASSFSPYHGFTAENGAVSEYNGKFMSGQYVLRGGSCATPEGHVRSTYRNFWHPDKRWQFSGLRLAEDVKVSDKARFEVAEDTANHSEFLQSVLSGLSTTQKTLDCKYLYDEAGSELFDAICDLPEYYPTRTEISILDTWLSDVAALVGEGVEVIELGSGAGRKTKMLLDALNKPSLYVPVDISKEFVLSVAEGLRNTYPAISIQPVIADFMDDFPVVEKKASRMLFFPGSTIGNLTPVEANAFLKVLRQRTNADYFLIGVDLQKDTAVLEAAYDDAAGVTADFNLNLLKRANSELEANFDVQKFKHQAVYNAELGRVEMHLVSQAKQKVMIAGQEFCFAEGETIHTENSYKYPIGDFSALIAETGWELDQCWTDDEKKFAVLLLKA